MLKQIRTSRWQLCEFNVDIVYIIVQYHWGLDFQDWLGVVFLSQSMECMPQCYPAILFISLFLVFNMFQVCLAWCWPGWQACLWGRNAFVGSGLPERSHCINHKQPPCSHLCWVAEPRRLYNDFGREPPWCIKCEAGRSRFWLPLIMIYYVDFWFDMSQQENTRHTYFQSILQSLSPFILESMLYLRCSCEGEWFDSVSCLISFSRAAKQTKPAAGQHMIPFRGCLCHRCWWSWCSFMVPSLRASGCLSRG